MSLSTLKPISCRISPASGVNEPRLHMSNVSMMKRQSLPPLQVQAKEILEKPLFLQESLKGVMSRRELFHLTTAATSLSLLTLILPAHAAEPQLSTNANILQRIVEKFQQLGQKIGLSKGNDGDKEKKPVDEAKGTVTKLKDEAAKNPNKGGEEKKALTPPPVMVPPNGKGPAPARVPPPAIINGKTVETTTLP